jgi:hypothetical protein
MNKDLGVWTYQDCALVLIDYQKEMFDSIRSETTAALADLNVRLLAKTAKRTPGQCRTPRSLLRRNSSAIGPRPSPTRRARLSIGTSPKFRR